MENERRINAHFAIFEQFWVYVLVTLALTVVTLSAFMILDRKLQKLSKMN